MQHQHGLIFDGFYRKYRLLIISFLSVVVLILGYQFVQFITSPKPYLIAFIGRYESVKFDKVHEIILKKYLNALNTKLSTTIFELRSFDNNGDRRKSKRIYETIANDPRYLMVIDNTWGKELEPAAQLIRNRKIPVISLNADKNNVDFYHNVLFLGYGDKAPEKLVAFIKYILHQNSVIFVSEESYALSEKFTDEFQKMGITAEVFQVSLDIIDPVEKQRLISSLDSAIQARKGRRSKRNSRTDEYTFSMGR